MNQLIASILRSTLSLPAVVFCLLPISHILGLETDVQGFDEQSVFSQTFRTELAEADRGDDSISKLEALHRKYTKPAEQAEIELTLARVLSQRTGFVDPAESIKWYDKALVRDLPPTTLAKHFILRGNMHERLDQINEAIADYMRGLLICLQYNLPEKRPEESREGKLQPPPIHSGFGDRNEAQLTADSQRAADYQRERQSIRREQDLLMQRYYYVEALKRVMKPAKLNEQPLRNICEKLTNRQDRIDEVLHRWKEPNPQPWP